MILAVLFALTAARADSVGGSNGRAGETRVRIPRMDSTAVVDGRLDEPVWSKAARLTGFSQYQPVDGRAADEPTEVLVWYASDAIWFGIRAREIHGNVVRATRANRDNIASEDYVQILLDTYNDRRNTFLFGVNPLGVQQDGTRTDQYGGGAGGRSATGSGMASLNGLDGNVDLNPDFVFDSRGRLTEDGYEVEIRIPFKTLKYQDAPVQNWGLHILRKVQHTGAQDSWTPALRANASFLTQEGTLEGIHDITRGLVLEAVPTVTAHANGAPRTDGWHYDSGQDFGGDVRWGVRQNLTLNATVNPDFSQVEADVGQVTLNERFALFYPEKRPFFLEGLELYDTPNQLIYTRRVVAPTGGVKFSGKIGGTNLATMLAEDEGSTSWSGDHRPVFGIARMRRDLGHNNTLGTILTTREDGPDFSRLAGADVRLIHSKLYYVQLQAVQSWTDSAGQSLRGPFAEAVWDRTGRASGFHYNVKAISPEFRSAAGFVNRTGIIDLSAHNRITFYGAPDALVQTWSAFGGFERFLDYKHPGDGSIEGSESMTPSATLRGGWRLNGGLFRNFVSYVPSNYTTYAVVTNGQTAPFTVPGPDKGLWSGSFGATTPTYRRFTASATYALGQAALFREAAPGRSSRIDASIDLRPSAGLRTSVQFTRLALDRDRDGSPFSRETIPRVKFEYQINPAMFVRLVGQYSARTRDPLVDRNGDSILVNGVRDTGDRTNEFQMDWLFSYRPVPGTLFYFGYGSTMNEPSEFRFNELKRSHDGFFAKLTYLFRL